MRITRICATWLRVPIPAECQHVSDYGRATSFDSTLVRVETDSGITGFGEARGALPSTGNCASLVTRIDIPDRPGLGVGIDEQFVRRYAMQ